MPHPRHPPLISWPEARRVAFRADCDPRSVRRFVDGARVGPELVTRIARAMVEEELAHLVPTPPPEASGAPVQP